MTMRDKIFFYDVVLIIVLVALAATYLLSSTRYGLVPDSMRLVVHSTWFGMLGGIVISLKGIYDHPVGHTQGWDDGYNLWHFGRPVSGGVVGFMTLVLLQAINPKTSPSEPVLYVASFILGTQERRFFSFLYEVARLILQVPQEQETGALSVAEIQPSQGHANDIMVIRGNGFAPNVTATIGTNVLLNPQVSRDGSVVAGQVPPAPAAGPVTVTVANPNGTHVAVDAGFT